MAMCTVYYAYILGSFKSVATVTLMWVETNADSLKFLIEIRKIRRRLSTNCGSEYDIIQTTFSTNIIALSQVVFKGTRNVIGGVGYIAVDDVSFHKTCRPYNG